MKSDVAQILKEALTLPVTERAALAKSLVASLAPSTGADAADVRVSSDVDNLYDQARDRALARLRDGIGRLRPLATMCIAGRRAFVAADEQSGGVFLL